MVEVKDRGTKGRERKGRKGCAFHTCQVGSYPSLLTQDSSCELGSVSEVLCYVTSFMDDLDIE